MDLFVLAARQYGVFSAGQAADHHVTSSTLANWLAQGRVTHKAPAVYAISGAPGSYRQRVMAACLSVPGSLASHRCAARLWGLEGSGGAPVEILTERWRRRRRGSLAFIVHETKDLVASDISERWGIPCTSLIRTLVDLPAVAHEFRCGQGLDSASRVDRSVLPRVRQRHREVARRGRNGTVVLRNLLRERGVGDRRVDSGFERKALRLVGDAGLPAPVTQHEVCDGDFVAYLDLAWPAPRVGLECESLEHHFGERAHQWDRYRRRKLIGLGWTIVEATWQDVTRNRLSLAADLRRILASASARSGVHESGISD